MQYLIIFLDLLITCTSTQSQFVADMFKEPEFVNVFNEELIKRNIRQKVSQAFGQTEINPGVQALVNIIESKVVILLSEMSNNKVSESFMRKVNEADDLMKVFEHSIKPMLSQLQQIPNFEYQGDIA
jgi:ABC-type arginine transport system ATPase subunit